MRHKKALVLALLLVMPVFAYAQDYAVSPSAGSQYTTTTAVQTQRTALVGEYSYIDRPFDDITALVRVRTTSDNRNVIHNLTILVSNRGTVATISVNPLYCKIGTSECKRLPCDYSMGDIVMPRNTFFERRCVIKQSVCAGHETRIEYSMPVAP